MKTPTLLAQSTAALLLAAAALPLAARADTISFTILAGEVSGTTPGEAIDPDTMLQLIDLGPDGIFNPIPEGSWVGGDDTIVTAPFATGEQNVDGWLSAGSFDLSDGVGASGEINRIFQFMLGEDVNVGDRIGIRWFPTIAANNNYISLAPTGGVPYGQFTRQASPRHGGSLWRIPAAGAFVGFDAFLTSDYTPSNPDAPELGSALFAVIPEPSTAVLAVTALAALVSARLRRRVG